VIDDDGCRAEQAAPQANGGALCMFEFFYLARPDTRLAGVEVHGARVRMGERLAEEAPVEADLVCRSRTRARRPRSVSPAPPASTSARA
jgi:amidophosphoribosyltransferase